VKRAQKLEFITSLRSELTSASTLVVARYEGLSVSQMTALRASIYEAKGRVKVVKNRLAKRAVQDTKLEHISGLLTGPTLIAYSEDLLSIPKIFSGFSKNNKKLVVLGGALNSDSLNPEGVKFLAEIPSLDELHMKLVYVIRNPATRITQVISKPSWMLTHTLRAYSKDESIATM
jgi:large subunit ribosomal protein L10